MHPIFFLHHPPPPPLLEPHKLSAQCSRASSPTETEATLEKPSLSAVGVPHQTPPTVSGQRSPAVPMAHQSLDYPSKT
jgi:hypothetical protein